MSKPKAMAPVRSPIWSESAGVETLRRMAAVDRYNEWIASQMVAHVGRQVLEVGCGIGNMTPFFVEQAERVMCIDVSADAVAFVRASFAQHPQVSALAVDISAPGAVARLGAGSFDTVVCINVLEHIERDAAALRGMFELLLPGGKLLLFVPAGQYLYGHLDRALGHFRRYALGPLGELVRAQGFAVLRLNYMNLAGIPGWFLSSRVLRRETPPANLLWLFNLLMPLFASIETRVRLPIGQSLLLIAQRPSGEPAEAR